MLENPLNSKIEKRENLILKRKALENNEVEEKITSKIELEVILNSNPSHRVCILVDIKSTLSFLSVKIADYMEHFPTYSNLDGLKAINFSKKTEKGVISIPINSNGEVKDHFENGNTIYCDLKSEEYWIKTILNLSSSDKKLSISLDIKAKVEMMLVKLKLLLLKMALNIWIDFCKNDHFHYIFIGAKLEIKNTKRNFNLDISDLTKKSSFDEMKIIELFDFDSEICCNFKLISLEELIFNQLVKYKSSEFEDKNKFELLQQINFKDFTKSTRFEDEQKTIQSLIKKYLSNPLFCVKGSIYCYQKTNKGKFLKNLNSYEGLASEIIIMPSKNVLKNTSLLEGSDVGSFSEPNVFLKDDHISTKIGFNSFISSSKDNFGVEIRGQQDNQEKRKENLKEEKYTELEKATIKISKRFSQDNMGIINFEKSPFKLLRKNNDNKGEDTIVDIKEESKEEIRDPNVKLYKSFIQKGMKKSNSKKDISYSKISTISNRNQSLSPDIIRLIFLDKFNSLIETNSAIRVSKVSLEKITMPQFRSMKMNKGDNENTELGNKEKSTHNETVASVYNNKRVLIIIGVMFVIVIIVIIICLCI